MIERFQIEELISQDATGVIFRAHDTLKDNSVAIRRFFPTGLEGDGLTVEGQVVYLAAIEKLKEVSHPTLRTIVAGGCDPIDGMPYIVTEWIDGKSVEEVMKERVHKPEDAREILVEILEISKDLSEVMGEEAIWVETGLQTIQVSKTDAERAVTLWMRPLKNVGIQRHGAAPENILRCAEELTGWKGRPVSDQGGRGLGKWVKWLRESAKSTTLDETLTALYASAVVTPKSVVVVSSATPTSANLGPATAPIKALATPAKAGQAAVGVVAPEAGPLKGPLTIQKPKNSPRGALISIVILGLIAAGSGAWFLSQKKSPRVESEPTVEQEVIQSEATDAIVREEKSVAPSPPLEPVVVVEEPEPPPEFVSIPAAGFETAAERASRKAAELTKTKEQANGQIAAMQGKVESRGGVYTIADYDLLMEMERKVIVVEGVFQGVSYSTSKITMYLAFSVDAIPNEVRGAIRVKEVAADLAEAALTPLIGKKIRVEGYLRKEKVGSIARPLVEIRERKSIREVP